MSDEHKARLVLEALLGMVMQHCAIDGRPGRYTHDFLSANEEAFDLLEQLGIIRDVGAEEYELAGAPAKGDDDEQGGMMDEMTAKERKAIAFLHKAAKIWPGSLWVFAADGHLNIMRRGADGEYVMTGRGGVDQDYIIDTVFIDSDGGDW